MSEPSFTKQYCLSTAPSRLQVPGLLEILADPVRRFLPVTLLPEQVRQSLLSERKFMHAIFDSIVTLSNLGLVALADRDVKDKSQVCFYSWC